MSPWVTADFVYSLDSCAGQSGWFRYNRSSKGDHAMRKRRTFKPEFRARDENVGLVAQSVSVHCLAGRAAIVEENLAIAPGLVLVGDDVVLEITDLFSLLECSFPPCPVAEPEH